MRLSAALVAAVVAAAALASPAASAPATESCESWGEGQKGWSCGKACKHGKEGGMVLQAMNEALGVVLEKASIASKIPVVSGVVKSKAMDHIRGKLGECHAKACEDGSLVCLKNAKP